MSFPQVIARYVTSVKSDKTKDDLDLAVFVREILETENDLDDHWRRLMNMAHSYIVTKHPRTRVRFKVNLNKLTETHIHVEKPKTPPKKTYEQTKAIEREMELYARVKDPTLLIKDVFMEEIESTPKEVTISEDVTYTRERYNEHEQKIKDPSRFRKGT
tara:strand:+ start:5086 stop:5562 length:477 start_codon:yes stop_codon:yes gene_type:complete